VNRVRIARAADVAAIEARPYRDYLAHGSVLAALEDASGRHASRRALTAILDAGRLADTRQRTHAELIADIRRAANLFATLAGGEAPRVAFLMPAIPQAYLTLWGAEAAGTAFPINYLLSAAHIAELLRAAGTTILVALGPHPALDIWSRAQAVQALCPQLHHLIAVNAEGGTPAAGPEFDALLRAQPGDRLIAPRAIDAASPAALFHTGGTTGAPKMAQHTHGNQLHAAWGAAQMYASTETDVMLSGFPLFHVAGAFVFGLSTLLAGGELVLPPLLGLRDPVFVRRYWDAVAQHRVTLLAAVPTVIATLLGVERGQADTGSVRALLTGGSPLPTELAQAFEQRFGIPVRNILGMTECAGVISIEPFLGPRTPGSCGLPLPFTTVEAVAPDGQVCAPGATGVLRVRGPHVGPGYTDARRNPGTFEPGGWLVTGDLGHVDAEGRVFVTGRAKDVIIRSSHNIDPGVIEEALLGHPDVQLAAAVGEPDAYAGELPVAFVVLRPGATVTEEALIAFATPRIPERPACPKRVTVLPELPLTAIGKVYKPALRLRAAERAIGEHLAAAGLDRALRVEGHDAGSGLTLHFTRVGDAPPADLDARLRDLMRAFALDWRLR
jgi:fatty-acyl-CoA synthase